MSQTQDKVSLEWIEFIKQATSVRPVDLELIMQYVKIRTNSFPTDDQMREYYEEVFSKSTSEASRKKWHQQDKFLLIWCMAKHMILKEREELIPEDCDWEYLSKVLGVEKQLLELKWISLLHSNLKIAPWSKEEDQLLIQIAQQCYQKNNWTELTIKFNSISNTQRYPKQIRERWNNVLNPLIQRTAWSKEEKLKLITLILNYGKKWSKIQCEIEGRSENQIKNQYNGIIRNLKRFNVQEVEECLLLKAIIDNPNEKMSVVITRFMADLLKKKSKENQQKSQQQQHDSQIVKKNQQEIQENGTVTSIRKNNFIDQQPINGQIFQQNSPISLNLPQYQTSLNLGNNYQIDSHNYYSNPYFLQQNFPYNPFYPYYGYMQQCNQSYQYQYS